MTAALEPEVVCGAVCAACVCVRRRHPLEEPCRCSCGGRWQFPADDGPDGLAVVHAWPENGVMALLGPDLFPLDAQPDYAASEELP